MAQAKAQVVAAIVGCEQAEAHHTSIDTVRLDKYHRDSASA